MKGLVKKDLMMIKSNLKLIGIMLIIFTIMAITGTSDISFLPAFMMNITSGTLMQLLFQMEEKIL